MKFTKKQILGMSCFRGRRDLLAVLLDDGKQYSKDDVTSIIGKFMKGKVK